MGYQRYWERSPTSSLTALKSHVPTVTSQVRATCSTAPLGSIAARITFMVHDDTRESRDCAPETSWSTPLTKILGLLANGARLRSKLSQSYIAISMHNRTRSFRTHSADVCAALAGPLERRCRARSPVGTITPRSTNARRQADAARATLDETGRQRRYASSRRELEPRGYDTSTRTSRKAVRLGHYALAESLSSRCRRWRTENVHRLRR